MYKIVLLIIIIVLLTSCIGDLSMDDSWSVSIENTTNEKIYVMRSYNYPDTTIPKDILFSVMPKSSKTIELSSNENELSKELKSDTVSIFFFEKKLIDSNSIDEIIQKNLYTMRKDFHYLRPDVINYP